VTDERAMEFAGQHRQNVSSATADAVPYDRAWWVLLGASICMFCGQPAVAYYTFGVFIPEIVADTHWPGATIAAAIGPGALFAAVVAPLAGRACDKWGVRAVALVGGPTYAIGLAVLGLGPTGPRSFTGLMMLMWVLAFTASPVPYSHIVSGWFDRRRGLALSVIFCCGALGIAVWPPYAASLITHMGWRHAYVVLGSSAGAVVFLAALLLLRNPPVAAASAGESRRVPGMLVKEALSTARFWKVAAIFLLLSAVLGGTALDFPVILRQHGADARTAASVMSVIGIAMFLGRLSLGLMLDRWYSPYVTIAITVVSMLAFVLLMATPSYAALRTAAGLLGYGLGAEFAAAAYIASRAFGIRAFGGIYGLIMLASSIGTAVGPAAIGASLLAGINVTLIYASALAFLVPAILILLTLRKSELPFVPTR
jgi:OFA family oxalate/formate antiporter-like MFS transporter